MFVIRSHTQRDNAVHKKNRLLQSDSPTSGFVYQDAAAKKVGQIQDPVVLLEGNWYGGASGSDNLKRSSWKMDGKKLQDVNVYSRTAKKTYFFLSMWVILKWKERRTT